MCVLQTIVVLLCVHVTQMYWSIIIMCVHVYLCSHYSIGIVFELFNMTGPSKPMADQFPVVLTFDWTKQNSYSPHWKMMKGILCGPQKIEGKTWFLELSDKRNAWLWRSVCWLSLQCLLMQVKVQKSISTTARRIVINHQQSLGRTSWTLLVTIRLVWTWQLYCWYMYVSVCMCFVAEPALRLAQRIPLDTASQKSHSPLQQRTERHCKVLLSARMLNHIAEQGMP